MPRKARIFVGSSVEGLPVAHAIRSLLAHDAHISLWNEGVFKNGESFLEGLVNRLREFDFAILVATPDDTAVSREVPVLTPRDNVIFELGLFMGRLGRGRVFLVHPARYDLKLPSDLLGIVTASCEWPDVVAGGRVSLQSYMSALGPACDQIREVLHNWEDVAEHDVLSAPGFVRCYTNATDAQAAIGRAIAGAKRSIFLMATNLSYTPVLNVAEFQQRIREGVEVRFLVLHPLSAHVEPTAREFLISVSQLNQENRLHLGSLVELREFSLACRRGSEAAGLVSIRLYDAPPRMRSYSFDWPDGHSFFVPYMNRATSRPLPVYEFRNGGGVAVRYLQAIEHLWNSPDTTTIDDFVAQHPDFFD